MEIKAFPGYPKSDPRFYFSKNKIPGSPLIVFVHFYGGHQKVLKRHIQLVNELGFDAFAYNMPDFAGPKLTLSLYYRKRFGLKHLYAHMLAFFLDQIPGPKIIFGFSNPSAAAIEVIYDRIKENKKDVVGLICDSGPSGAFLRSAWNLAIRVRGQYSLLGFFSFFWSLRQHHEVDNQLKKFPKNFPLLSLRGGSDPIIPPWHIDLLLKKVEGYLRIKTVIFPEAGHLDALKKFPELYHQAVEEWLRELTPSRQ